MIHKYPLETRREMALFALGVINSPDQYNEDLVKYLADIIERAPMFESLARDFFKAQRSR